ncbi:MAG: protein-export chaperone SecB [Bacteroidales bacterium]|jgi:preprotein translocase subunit SecB
MVKLKGMTIVVNQAELVNNNLPQGEFKFTPLINRKTGKIDEIHKYFTQLNVEIKDKPEERFPVNVSASINGIFEFEEGSEESEIGSFLKLQAVHILYPYMRSLISNLASISMLPPIILPIVDAFHLFPEDNIK